MKRAGDLDVRRLFDEVLDRPEGERRVFLQERCGADAALREEVEELLRYEGELDGFYEDPIDLDLPGDPARLPEKIGDFRPIRVIGAGGMGLVYLAEQDHPRRRVALKLVRGGTVATSTLERRFRNEIELLGRLEHPGIARIYEAGTAETDVGPQPYFAMELVDGRPLNTYVEEERTPIRERVQLLARVAEAVEHAHVHGVVHRDLKPANILVRPDGSPVVLDFGIARTTDSDIAATTFEEGGRNLVGTLAYMSPEQATGELARVDERSDVHALGIVLYELLAGELPYELQDLPLHRAVKVIVETEPRPLGESDPGLRGDLTTITQKALEKDPARRYASARAFAEDLRRHLGDEPIAARPASTRYQLEKLVRRNRKLLFALAAVLVALLIGLAGTGWQALRATRAADDARDQWERAELLAVAAKESASIAESHAADVLRLSDVKRLRDLKTRAEALWPVVPARLDEMREWMQDAHDLLARRESHAGRLVELRSEATPATETLWWQETLEELLRDLDAFTDESSGLIEGVSRVHGWGMERRIAFAEGIEFLETSEMWTGPWAEAIESIADVERCPMYGGLRITPQLGLFPVGRDPDSGLWEFSHQLSLNTSKRDPDTGRLLVTNESGVVFVLLPGGTVLIGSQGANPGAPNYDPRADEKGVVLEVTLPPFFMSKYELSQAQWQFATNSRPSYRSYVRVRGKPVLPVESVSWVEARRVLSRWGMELPTEAQWEYAARGGTSTPWATGGTRETLIGAANLADTAGDWPAASDWPEFEDGYVRQAPIDALRPNGFGLHHVHGNLQEMCLEVDERLVNKTLNAEEKETANPGLFEHETIGKFQEGWVIVRTPIRGGGFHTSASQSRIGAKAYHATDAKLAFVGIRPVKELEIRD